MEKIISSIAALLAVAVSSPVWAGEYGASNFGGSASLTWLFFDSDTSNVSLNSPPIHVGYFCHTRDTLGAMSRTAIVERYEILVYPNSSDYFLEPINGVIVSPSGDTWVAEAIDPNDEQIFWDNAQLNESYDWFMDDQTVDELGRACVDGGIAAAIGVLEAIHGNIVSQ